jgi:hypothetical protein
MRRRSFEEILTRRELVVLGIKLVTVVLTLWLFQHVLPEIAKVIFFYLSY